jgi:hypothetical protein
MSKLERYTAVLHPGDVLINPPWFWHGTKNLGDSKDIIVGCPSRYGRGVVLTAAFRSNPLLTVVGVSALVKKYGFGVLNPNGEMKLQTLIAANRNIRNQEQMTTSMEGTHAFDVEAALND